MQRTTLVLPPNLKARVMARARAHNISFGEFVRRSLEKSLEQPITKDDSFWADKGVYKGYTPANLSQCHDDYLYGDSE